MGKNIPQLVCDKAGILKACNQKNKTKFIDRNVWWEGDIKEEVIPAKMLKKL